MLHDPVHERGLHLLQLACGAATDRRRLRGLVFCTRTADLQNCGRCRAPPLESELSYLYTVVYGFDTRGLRASGPQTAVQAALSNVRSAVPDFAVRAAL